MRRFAILILSASALVSCSTTRVLREGQYRLDENRINVDDRNVPPSQLYPYLRQQANTSLIFGWAPGQYIYNWSNESDKGFSGLCKKIGQAPVIFNEAYVQSSVENIKDHMAYLGYYDAEVSASVKYNGRKVSVTYDVKTGGRIRIGDVQYKLPADKSFRDNFSLVSSSTLLRKDEFLSEDLVEKESSRALSVLHDIGYYDLSRFDFAFAADTFKVPGSARIDYIVNRDSVRRYRFGKVDISITKDFRFNPATLQNTNIIRSGDVYNASTVSKTYSRFSSLPVFSGVNIETVPSDDGTVDCNIKLTPSKQRGVKVNLEGSFTSSGLLGISPRLSFYNKNLFRSGEWLNVDFSGDFQFQPSSGANSNEFGVSAKLSLQEALLFSSGSGSFVPRTDIGISYNYQNRPEFNRHIFALTYGYSGQWGMISRYQINPLQINHVLLNNISEDFRKTLDRNPLLRYSYTDHIDVGLGMNVLLSSDFSINPDVSFRSARLSLQTSGNLLSLFNSAMRENAEGQKKFLYAPYSQFIRADLTLIRNIRFGRDNDHAVAFRIIGGAAYAYGNSNSVPFEKKFYVGGADGMRGWQARTLGPGGAVMDASFQIPSQTGDVKLEADAELRLKLFWKLEAAIFAEAGNVWDIGGMREFYKDIAGDWGLGARLNLDFIILRFDFGFKVHDPARAQGHRWLGPAEWFTSNGWSFNFGVGYPF